LMIALIVFVHSLFPIWSLCYHENLDFLPAALEAFTNPTKSIAQFQTYAPALEHYLTLLAFVLFEALLMLFLPSDDYYCPPTPAGNTTKFRINALPAWFVTVAAYFGVQFMGMMPPTYIHDNFWQLLVGLLILGDAFTVVFYIKGIYFPTNSDATFRNKFWSDIYLGIELHPKIGALNCKLFCIGRIGMFLWTIVNLAHAQKEYETLGHLSWPMIMSNLFAAIYTVDWAWKECWYIRTIDMNHDRFGFMLICGPPFFIPTFFCCNTFYLTYRPRECSTPFAIFLIVFFCVSYVLFRICNDQKDLVRSTKGEKKIWGYIPTVIQAKYTTSDGKLHESLLLASHLWGASRHFNYFMDWCMSFCYGWCVGFDGIVPHLYFIYMICLLTGRAYRDDAKCRNKYGEYWDQYCEQVPYIIVPYVF